VELVQLVQLVAKEVLALPVQLVIRDSKVGLVLKAIKDF
jgi:hypothetical protein